MPASLETIRHLHRPAAFLDPELVTAPPSWLGHVPFAFWIVEALRPRILVELGTHTGNSYAAFCQGVRHLGLTTACFAVDTWQGDPQAGFYGDEIHDTLAAFHDPRFGSFSRLLRTTFDEACQHFADGSIDLLHIDGLHTYEAVRHDFETWLPKLSDRAVVLFHDATVREKDFGVWRFWDEVSARHPGFLFPHSNGLGVLGVGSDLPEPVRWLLSLPATEPETVPEVRAFFNRLGEPVIDRETQRQLRATIAHYQDVERHLRGVIDQVNGEVVRRDGEIHRLNGEIGNRDAEIIRRDGEIIRRDSELHHVNGQLAGRSRELAELQAHATGEFARLNVEVARRDGEIARRDGELQRLSGHVERLETRLASIHRSVSWRISAPIRIAGRLARKAGRGPVGRGGKLLYWGLTFQAGKRLKARKLYQTIARSGLFDPGFYLARYRDVALSGGDPLMHYVLAGAAEGRDPCPLFDTAYYIGRYPDVAKAGFNPLAHYVAFGAAEGRAPNPFFDTAFYLRQNPDVAAAGLNPLAHYAAIGGSEGRDPGPHFSSAAYLAANPDVAAAGLNPLAHFLRHGADEGRPGGPEGATARGVAPILHDRLYDRWISVHERLDAATLAGQRAEAARLGWKPVFSIVVPTYETPADVLEPFLDSVIAQSYPHWELCIADDASRQPHVRETLERYAAAEPRIRLTFRSENGHIAEATNTALDMATGDYICLMDHDDTIAPNALWEFARLLDQDPGLDFIYSDEDKITPDGQTRYEPFFKPDWSPEYLEACMYTAHFACYRTSLVRQVGGFRKAFNGAQDYDFVLRFTERVGRVAHVPKVLYHWRAIPGSTAASMDSKDYVIDAAVRALTERVERTGTLDFVRSNRYGGCFDVRRKVEGKPRVSIVIPTAGRCSDIRGESVDLLVHCIRSIMEKSTYPDIEIVAVHNGDLRPETVAALQPYPIVYVHYTEPVFNVAAKMNLGARAASGDYVLFLNDDIEVISPDWIEAMLSLAQRPGVGAVGAKLYFEDGTLQHVGVAFCAGLPDHIRRGFGGNDPGYFFSTVGQRNYLAVTGACVLLRHDLFREVGGFEEAFAINYNDVDLCLKVWKRGLRIVYAAQAELYHFESRNRERTVATHEQELFLERWADTVRNDPFYSPYFAARPPDFELAVF